MLAISNLSKSYIDNALFSGVSFNVSARDRIAVIGPNGSGKSTLLRLGAGVLRPAAGNIRLTGQDIRRMARRQIARILGYLPQQVTSGFDYRVEEIVAMGNDPEVVTRVVRLVDASEYKRRQAPPGVRITPRALGRDRRLPLTNRFRWQPGEGE